MAPSCSGLGVRQQEDWGGGSALLPGCGPSGLTAWYSRWTHPLSCTCPASVASRPVCPHLLRKQKLQGLLWPCEALAWSDPVSPHSVDRLSPNPTKGKHRREKSSRTVRGTRGERAVL